MTIEKGNPIPPGFYWLDLSLRNIPKGSVWDMITGKPLDSQTDPDKVKSFQIWLGAVNKDAGKEIVKTIKNDGPWKLFEIKENAVRWPASFNLGFPSVASYGEKTTAQDEVHTPTESTDILDMDGLSYSVSEVGKSAALLGAAAIVSAVAVPVSLVVAATYILGKMIR